MEDELSTLTANINGKVRREKLFGRDYYVAPMTMLVEGVLNGSLGPVFYPDSEIKQDPSIWNHMPIVADHPKNAAGKYVSARSPKILEKYGIGTVFESVHNGKLDAEAWFDVERTKLIEPRIATALENNESLELSTGLGAPLDKTPGVFNGTAYVAIARNFRPDHLAVLVDKTGACSRKDGCGILANEEKTLVQKFGELLGVADLLELINRKEPAKAPVITKESDMAGKLSETDRKVLVDNLIANCDCGKKETALNTGPWTESDREALSKLPDETLSRMEESRKVSLANAKLVEIAKKGVVAGEQHLLLNAESGKFETKPVQKTDPDIVDNLDTSTLQVGDRFERVMVNNQMKWRITRATQSQAPATQPKQMTNEEFMKFAPPDVQRLVRNAKLAEDSERATLVEAIFSNPRNARTKEDLGRLDIEDLRERAALAGVSANAEESRASYVGAAPPLALNRGFREEDNDMAPPVMNWDEDKDAA